MNQDRQPMTVHLCPPLLRFLRNCRLFVVALQLILALNSQPTTAKPVPCNHDSECLVLQGAESTCGPEGICSNPFESGCLYRRLPGWTKKRVCNSEDLPEAEGTICEPPLFDYLEVRMTSGNWESIVFNAWLLQILLSELLGVPTTLEPGQPDTIMNFYEASGAFEYGSINNTVGFANALKHTDCRLASRNKETYEPCIHLIPEFWSASGPWATEAMNKGEMEPPEALGVLARETLFLPKFTAQRDPTLLSYIGMQGEENRQKLAEAFLRPTLWNDYCEQVSPHNCSEPDDVAQRAPGSTDEGNNFFVEGLYMGHFRKTDQNNCTLHPKSCTGFLVDYPCDWSSYAEQQMHHLNISLSGDKHGEGARGVDGRHTPQILKAANATKSNIITVWALPDPYYQSLVGTEMELHAIVMPPVTQECLAHKRNWDDACSGDMAARVGDPRGACDEPPVFLHKALSTSLAKDLNGNPSLAEKSPAVAAIHLYSVTAPIYGSWFDLLIERQALDESRVTAMRDATCQWAVENFDLLKRWVPFAYPRVVEDGTTKKGLVIASIATGGLSILLVLLASALVYKSQNRRVMLYAQVEFLWLLLSGLLIISVGALMAAVPPTQGSCIATVWLVQVGYTVELAPLLAKVAAINALVSASKRLRKVTMDRQSLFQSVFAVTALIVVFLVVWTSMDAPRKQGELTLSTDLTANNETIVYQTYYCSSESHVWQYVGFGWIYVMLFSSTVLAFQMRNIRQEFNESQTLGMMTYSHFVFAILRVIIFFLDDLGDSDRASYSSILLSVDSMAALAIYFLPKFLVLRTPDDSSSDFGTGFSMPSSSNPNAFRNSDSRSFRASPLKRLDEARKETSEEEKVSERPELEQAASQMDGSGDGDNDSTGLKEKPGSEPLPFQQP